eukprot:1351889-Prymnesium_polylepis.1
MIRSMNYAYAGSEMDVGTAALRLLDARAAHQKTVGSLRLRRNISAKRLQRAFRKLLRRRA